MGGLSGLNGVFKPVLNLASYIRYRLPLLLKTGLPRFFTCVTFSFKFPKGFWEEDNECISVENISFVLNVFLSWLSKLAMVINDH